MKIFLYFFVGVSMHLSASLSLDEKIGQLFVVPAYPLDENAKMEGQPTNNREYIEDLVKNYHVGGVLLKYNWDLEDQIETVKTLQKLAKTPLFIAQDCEWGVAMRLKNTVALPKNMALGAIHNVNKLFHVGLEIGRQCRIVGINLALAPVADVNSNPLNPVIGMRSFGDDPKEVAERVCRVVMGIQSYGVLACVKHFPGHGDTVADSHDELPILETMHLQPFKEAFRKGVYAVMTGHLLVKDVDDSWPASLSKKTVQKLLRKDMQFPGLVITDDLLMNAVRQIDDLVLRVFQSGTDLILSACDVPAGIEAVKRALEEGTITEREIDERVNRILFAKKFIGTYSYEGEINPEAERLNFELYREIVTAVHTSKGFRGPYRVINNCADELVEQLELSEKGTRLVILQTGDDKAVQWIDDDSVVVLLGSPYELSKLPKVPTLVGYDDSIYAQQAIADILNGMLMPSGRLPIKLTRSDEI